MVDNHRRRSRYVLVYTVSILFIGMVATRASASELADIDKSKRYDAPKDATPNESWDACIVGILTELNVGTGLFPGSITLKAETESTSRGVAIRQTGDRDHAGLKDYTIDSECIICIASSVRRNISEEGTHLMVEFVADRLSPVPDNPYYVGEELPEHRAARRALMQFMGKIPPEGIIRLSWKSYDYNELMPWMVKIETLTPRATSGRTSGIVTDIGKYWDGEYWIDIRSDTGFATRYVPKLTSRNGGIADTKTFAASVGRVEIGQRVRIKWTYDGKRRLESLQK